MKIYTGGGDRGRTGLFSGERVAKSNLQVEAYGDVDELNSTLGSLAASLPADWGDIIEQIGLIQADLFQIGAWLATTPGAESEEFLDEFGADRVGFLENAIDRMESHLPALSAVISRPEA